MNRLTAKQCALANVKSTREFLRQAEQAPHLCCPKAVKRATRNLPKYEAELARLQA